MRNRCQAEVLGFHVSAEAKEAQKQRDEFQEEKLQRLLKFQKPEGEKYELEEATVSQLNKGELLNELRKVGEETDDEEEEEEDNNDGEFNPNMIPLGSAGMKDEELVTAVR